ncbi:rho GDP-dissociation inhibitor 1-like [Ruditapes philippinarum]|uniref:rho GDP-dissociation inhibitor 1-like n=1 Tax=Ruditapes philippinarum TaxID=129788 RepID=UPI00295AF57E|nr:rho GDP-dissociation inhibitor 1-like [Ruditapes philippinarum]
MAESEDQSPQVEEVDDDESKLAYKPPAEKTIEEILEQDKDDESLIKYKQTLLGGTAKENVFCKFMSSPLTRHNYMFTYVSQFKKHELFVKEGVKYKLKITFNVQRQIVSGLRLVNKVSRGPASSKETYMVGSYAPRKEAYEYVSAEEEFPKGMLGRGDYKVKSAFTDDDKKSILDWEWSFQIKKDWKS